MQTYKFLLSTQSIEPILGIYTGSVYCDPTLRDNGFPAECVRNESVVVCKSHLAGEFEPSHVILNRTIAKVILLTRNPYDTFRAYYNLEKAGHTGAAKSKQSPNEDGKSSNRRWRKHAS